MKTQDDHTRMSKPQLLKEFNNLMVQNEEHQQYAHMGGNVSLVTMNESNTVKKTAMELQLKKVKLRDIDKALDDNNNWCEVDKNKVTELTSSLNNEPTQIGVSAFDVLINTFE